jgi:hypothetical protein
MSGESGGGSPVAAFGDPAQGVWGVAVGGSSPGVVWGRLDDASTGGFVPATMSQTDAEWRIAGDGLELTLVPLADGSGVMPDPEGVLELCRVAGRIDAAGAEDEAELGGVRCSALPSGRIVSSRLVAAWFPDGHAMALLAARPAGAKGQDRDALSVALSGEREGVHLFDPRLSTTYGDDGRPRRTGVELWLGETEEGDHYPRRVVGEADGDPVRHRLAGLEAIGLRCHSRGEDGIGVYLLVRG